MIISQSSFLFRHSQRFVLSLLSSIQDLVITLNSIGKTAFDLFLIASIPAHIFFIHWCSHA